MFFFNFRLDEIGISTKAKSILQRYILEEKLRESSCCTIEALMIPKCTTKMFSTSYQSSLPIDSHIRTNARHQQEEFSSNMDFCPKWVFAK